jgi:pantoate--beta-alanine ligase
MIICSSIEEMRAQVREWRRAGLRVGLVPTMGYLHEGHLSLVDLAAQHAERVVVSIYVNPTQFAPGEDLDKYPRDLPRDEAMCHQRGVQALFYPDSRVMYAPSHSTWVVVEGLTDTLCGRARPGHFRGVATVVAKLFNIVQPDVAVFGRKDAQQALVIQRLVRDLNQPVEIIVAPIVREADGLAMSSRNVYLTADERRRAVCISQALQEATQRHAQGEGEAADVCERVAARIQAGGGRLDYVECVSRDTLQPLARLDQPALLAVAAFFGKTRLIDNAYLG